VGDYWGSDGDDGEYVVSDDVEGVELWGGVLEDEGGVGEGVSGWGEDGLFSVREAAISDGGC